MKSLTLIVALGVAALAGGIGLVVAADHYGWIGASRAGAGAGSTCAHDIDADRCPFCKPELIESLGWCDGHDVAEALCTRCNSRLIPAFKAQGDWCAEHGLPESQCAICAAGPAAVAFDSGAAGASASNVSVGRDETLRANRQPSATCANGLSIVVLKSPEIAARAGLTVEVLRQATVEETIAGNAQVAFNGDRFAHLASRAAGTVAEVRARLGERVKGGDVLALIESSELGSAKAAYLQAHSLVELWDRNFQREQRLLEQRAGTERDVLDAETRLVESRVQLSSAAQRLRNLGLSESDIARVLAEKDTSSLLPLRAPFDGEVVERHAVIGEVIATTEALFGVADTSTMWVMLDLYERDVARVRPGLPVRLAFDGAAGASFEGQVAWISADVNAKTRTITARTEIDNPDGLLRANMFGRAEIVVRTIENAVLVPEAAVQWDGCCNLVFVRQTRTVFQPYKVTLGYKRDGYFVVEAGVPAGESVVTQGSFLLKTEILKGHIGAGCCEVQPGANK